MPLTNMRPVFYRVNGDVEVHSGWLNVLTGDICDTEETDQTRVRVIPNSKLAFCLGERVEFTAPVDLYPHDVILRSERAHVAYTDDETGEVQFLLEGIHDGLEGNVLRLAPFTDEETLASIRIFKVSRCTKNGAESEPSLGWVAAVYAAVMPLAIGVNLIEPNAAIGILGLTVVLSSLALGAHHALLLALAFAVSRNLFMVVPLLSLTPPSAEEFARAAGWVAASVLVPWVASLTSHIRRVLLRWERSVGEVEGEQSIHREG